MLTDIHVATHVGWRWGRTIEFVFSQVHVSTMTTQFCAYICDARRWTYLWQRRLVVIVTCYIIIHHSSLELNLETFI